MCIGDYLIGTEPYEFVYPRFSKGSRAICAGATWQLKRY